MHPKACSSNHGLIYRGIVCYHAILNCIPFWLVKSAFISHIYIVSQLWSNWYFYLHSSTNAFLADNCFGDNFIVPHFLLLGKFYSPFCKPFVENCHVYFFMWFLRWWVITIQSCLQQPESYHPDPKHQLKLSRILCKIPSINGLETRGLQGLHCGGEWFRICEWL